MRVHVSPIFKGLHSSRPQPVTVIRKEEPALMFTSACPAMFFANGDMAHSSLEPRPAGMQYAVLVCAQNGRTRRVVVSHDTYQRAIVGELLDIR